MSDPRRPLRDRLRDEAQRLGMPLDVVERDYAIGHILATVYGRDELAVGLVFKGGTALKKAYFGDYRFSVDLDFTALGGPRGERLDAAVAAVAAETQRRLAEQGPFAVNAARRAQSGEHPTGQEAFRILVRFPWHPVPLCSVKIEVTVDEPLLLPVSERALVHGYEETLAAALRCYSLEEIVAEKLRTLLQAQRRVQEGRWLRDCSRDYYDLWRILGSPDGLVDARSVGAILPEKCAVRGVRYRSAGDFFPPDVVATAARSWRSSLADLTGLLPEFDDVVVRLRQAIRGLVASDR